MWKLWECWSRHFHSVQVVEVCEIRLSQVEIRSVEDVQCRALKLNSFCSTTAGQKLLNLCKKWTPQVEQFLLQSVEKRCFNSFPSTLLFVWKCSTVPLASLPLLAEILYWNSAKYSMPGEFACPITVFAANEWNEPNVGAIKVLHLLQGILRMGI